MGFDIHMAVEKRGERPRRTWKMISREDASYGVRNYVLFRALAGVGYIDDVKPIAWTRGLPPDVTAATRRVFKSEDHSLSWLTIGEVRAYNWDATFSESGELDALAAARLILTGDPRHWSNGFSGLRAVDLPEMKRLLAAYGIAEEHIFSDAEDLDATAFPELAAVYLPAVWQRSIRSACSDFLSWIDMQDLVCRWHADEHPDDVRLVFSFDS